MLPKHVSNGYILFSHQKNSSFTRSEVKQGFLYEGVENANIIKFGEDKTLTSSPVVLSGLTADSKYSHCV